ncbi:MULTISPECIES: PRC-barrel domain-containing protein [Legionella]|uniref:PRC-barrel domain containing protein n=1 Tax=Legionella septentrionalis TaxID=2498109 RepID=A0A433JI34_9GAMM|nr:MULTISPECIES: PRC-barrel domain-containing protein [Legionella]MCP0913422.1 PRC-barrel domain-containing protein [Legionella sp. 27cVA30]RUQ84938.1 PRC-barrel domain containing protein [Legionella septentrionalis]RUQ99588.1 PRC-barrel domain containing protein [Legionella septentrionalis]RUR09841.1 PRC-barrel domain containing protein [Legionella septentrionalis]RUR13565.1 PRC-barrel domain containing protein [Legionella septentrionalis]
MHTNGSVVKSKDVVGTKVKNQQGEDLGRVEEIILDKEEGYVHYVVLSFGGFLGMGDKFFAMPWEIFTYDPNEECFVINVDKQKLENSPGFDKNHWPDMTSAQWHQNIHNYYGTHPRHNGAGRI